MNALALIDRKKLKFIKDMENTERKSTPVLLARAFKVLLGCFVFAILTSSSVPGEAVVTVIVNTIAYFLGYCLLVAVVKLGP